MADKPLMSSRRFWMLAAVGLLVFFYMVKGILLPFVVGLGAAYFLDPAADKLEKWGCSRNLATALITLAFFTVLMGAVAALAPVLYQQLSGLIRELPSYIQAAQRTYQPQLEAWLAAFGQGAGAPEDTIGGLAAEIAQLSSSVLTGLLKSGGAVFSLASLIVLTPVVTFYLLRDWDRLVIKLDELLPRDHAQTIRQQMREIDRTLASFVRGQINVCMILGVFYAVGLSLAGLKFAVLIGVAAGLLVIVPYVGTVISALLSLGIAYMQFGNLEDVATVGAVFVTGQMLEGYFLTPKLVGSRVGLHPVWVIFGMLAGGALFGFVGVLLAVPTSAVVGVLVRFAIEQYKRSDAYAAAPDPAPRRRKAPANP